MEPIDPANPYGVDLRLTDDGDLAVTGSGGLTPVQGPLNVAQAMVLRLRTWPGSLPLHPDYGNPLEERLVGRKTLDFDLSYTEARAVAAAIVQADRRVTAVEDITIESADDAGVGVEIGMKLVLADGEVLEVANVLALDIDALDLANIDIAAVDLDSGELLLDDAPDGEDLTDGLFG